MTSYDSRVRDEGQLLSLLQILRSSDGFCADPVLRRELLDTGFVRPDADLPDERLHLTPEGMVFIRKGRPPV